MRGKRVVAWLGFAALLALHLDFWRPQRPDEVTLYFGWVPGELAWRLVWMALAWASESGLTAKPWFWLVISTLPVMRLRTGWLAPRWPNLSL